MEPIVAYRAWKYHKGSLTSLNGTPWPVGKPLQKNPCCKDAYNCDCGIHVFKEPLEPKRGMILGRVKIGGEVFEHQDVYRAEFAEPIDLTIISRPALKKRSERIAHEIQSTYNIPCTVEII